MPERAEQHLRRKVYWLSAEWRPAEGSMDAKGTKVKGERRHRRLQGAGSTGKGQGPASSLTIQHPLCSQALDLKPYFDGLAVCVHR